MIRLRQRTSRDASRSGTVRTARPGAALLLVLALLSVALASMMLTGRVLAQSRAWRAHEAHAHQARSLLESARDPIRFWLNQRAGRVVLPPHNTAPLLTLLDARFDALHSTLRIDAADLRGIDPSPPSVPLPSWIEHALAALTPEAPAPRRLNIATAPDSILAQAIDPGALEDLRRSRLAGRMPELPPASPRDWQLSHTSDLWALRVEAACRGARVAHVHICAQRAGTWTTLVTLPLPPEGPSAPHASSAQSP
jgi:hypothetical protein